MSTHGFYYERKRLHLCVWCGKQDARTMIGRIYCYECNERQKARIGKLVKTPEHRKWFNEYQKAKRQERKEQGLCTECGKRKADGGKLSCGRCRAKARAAHREERIRKGFHDKREEIAKGNCAICFAPAVPGYKVCEKHLETMRKASKIAGEKRSEKARKRKEESND